MTRSGLTDSTSSSVSQPAVMSSGPTPMTSSGGDVLSSIEEFKRDESEVNATAVVSSSRVVSFEQTTTTVSFDIPEWQVQKSFDSECFESRPESELKNLESRPQSLSEAVLSRSSSEEPRPASKTSYTEAGNLKVDEPFVRPSTPEPPAKIEAMAAADDDVFEVMKKSTEEQEAKSPVTQPQQESEERAPLLEEEELCVTSPPPTETRPLGDLKFWPQEGAKTEEKLVESPVRMRRDRDVEEGKMWVERQFEGGVDPEAERDDALVGDGEDFYYSPPLDQIIEEEDESQDQQLERLKESIASAAPNLAVRGPPVMFQVRGGPDDTSSLTTMSSLQEFEKLEASVQDRGSQDSLEAGPIRPPVKKLKGDAISIDSSMSLKEFESLEQACKEATKIEKMAKEQEEVLSEIEEGHESQSESADTISHDDQRSEDDNSDDFEERMFEIDEIIKQAQTNVEKFGVEGGKKGAVSGAAAAARPEMLPLEEIIGRSDSRTESTGVDKTATPDSEDSLEAPDLPAAEAAAAAAGQLMQTSVDSLDLNKRHVAFEEDVMQTSADSLELNKSGGAAAIAMMTMSTDSIEGDKKRTQATTGAMMEQSTDSLDGNGRAATTASAVSDANIDARLGNGAKVTIMEASTDSLEGAKTAATAAAEDTIDVTHGGQVSIGHSVTEVIRASRGDFGHVVERTVEQPADVSRVVFRGPNSDLKLADYLANLGAYETVQETEYVDPRTGCAVTKRVVSQRTFVQGGGVDEQTVEEYDEFGNVKKFVLRSTSVPETVEVCRTIELISERPDTATTHEASRVVTTEYRDAYRVPQSRQIAGILGCTLFKSVSNSFFC